MAGDEITNSVLIEVDPKLFITCRLCLEEMGVYQIVPTVQQQIKYCFEISVEPFDGLPQLLCKKCKMLLDDYSSNKKKFIERQEALVAKLKIKQVQIKDAVIAESVHSDKSRSKSRSNSPIENSVINLEDIPQCSPSIQSANEKVCDSDDNIKLSVKSCNKRRTRLISNSSVDSEKYFAPKQTHKSFSKSSKWKKKFNKKFVCNICPKSYKSQTKMVRHLDDHSFIKSRYSFILSNPGRVTLFKFDEKPNLTNLDNTLVYDDEKILQDTGNPLYHVMYISRNNATKKASKRQYLESSDDNHSYSKKSGRISRSSNDTIFLGDNNKITESSVGESPGAHKKTSEIKTAVETVCINIDDSDSNTELETNANLVENTDIKVEFKTIENIISNCRIKYMNKFQNDTNINSSKKSSSENHLKHKILSIGRKIIHKDGQFNCTGLLRYMEQKNLEVMWIPKALDVSSRENLVRIMPKLKSASNNDNTSDKNGWINLPRVESCDTTSTISTPTVTSVNTSFNNSSICEIIPSAVLSKSRAPVTVTEVLKPPKPSHLDKKNKRYAELNNAETDIHSKRILNQSPVANPKQLPKKISATSESKLVVTKNMTEMTNQSVNMDLDEKETSESNLSMPIITSTTSLAPYEDRKKKEKDQTGALVPERSVPRIKVKPVSELMNLPTSNNNQNGMWPMNNTLENRAINTPNTVGNVYFQMLPRIQSVQSVQLPAFDQNAVMSVSGMTNDNVHASHPDFIILDSVELPNTKTDSPFRYCKDVLSLHNIYLLDPNISITQEYCNLLKMRVQFKEENKDKPIALCISLYCIGNSYCVCIKNTSNVDIPLTKISARWQWEIFKIFQGELSNKILQNSVKYGNEVSSNTKTFLYVLKSITHKQ